MGVLLHMDVLAGAEQQKRQQSSRSGSRAEQAVEQAEAAAEQAAAAAEQQKRPAEERALQMGRALHMDVLADGCVLCIWTCLQMDTGAEQQKRQQSRAEQSSGSRAEQAVEAALMRNVLCRWTCFADGCELCISASATPDSWAIQNTIVLVEKRYRAMGGGGMGGPQSIPSAPDGACASVCMGTCERVCVL
jgi:hypothetical protein